ncbi:MAG: hypothetical protein IH603_03075, partial [Burkholderia vietnamiensis]|nr:hypothetical protein [Burkholderia vietnamiensis]
MVGREAVDPTVYRSCARPACAYLTGIVVPAGIGTAVTAVPALGYHFVDW